MQHCTAKYVAAAAERYLKAHSIAIPNAKSKKLGTSQIRIRNFTQSRSPGLIARHEQYAQLKILRASIDAEKLEKRATRVNKRWASLKMEASTVFGEIKDGIPTTIYDSQKARDMLASLQDLKRQASRAWVGQSVTDNQKAIATTVAEIGTTIETIVTAWPSADFALAYHANTHCVRARPLTYPHARTHARLRE